MLVGVSMRMMKASKLDNGSFFIRLLIAGGSVVTSKEAPASGRILYPTVKYITF
jgi:hypothetical protein